ncbi:hypothetical protein [Hymenobacter bucti]|uniref:Uncharacterized protein n=1 Tax=Hymenobacter bucti TaxID=1844114 RepID=A0ABW4QUS6_9BACT
MTSPHLSERALQAAAEAAALLPAAAAAHLRGCPLCQGRVATYRQLFTAAAQLPLPAFDFDLAASVLAQLPAPVAIPRAQPALPWVLCWLAVPVLGGVGAFLALFGSALRMALQDVSTGLGAGLALVAAFLVAGQCLELLARHRRQLRLLAFS